MSSGNKSDAVISHPLFDWFISFVAFFGASGPILLFVQCMTWLKTGEWHNWNVGTALALAGYQPERLELLGVRKIIALFSGIPLWIATPTIAVLLAAGIFTLLDAWDKSGK